jgi:predicted MPP superfamily phosphohydrolase
MRFLFILIPVVGLTYLSWHVWQLLPWPTWGKVLAIVVELVAFALIFTIAGPINRMPLSLATATYEVGTSSIFVYLYLILIFLLLDLGRLVRLVPASWLHANGKVAGAIALVTLAIFVYGNVHYNHKYRKELTLEAHGKVAVPMKIVMMSDVHLGYHNRRSDLKKWVDMVNHEQADLILIAGDLIDMSVQPLLEEGDAEELRRLNAPVYACLGNHEYFSGNMKARQFYHDAGIHLLVDSAVTIGDVCLIGRDDRMNRGRKPLKEIMGKADRSKYTIVMDHEPYHLEEAEQCDVDFQLSGHTHDGQLWPISWITDAIYECSFGDWRRGDTQYYITSGIGIWGGKYRIGTRSEYVVATLRNM